MGEHIVHMAALTVKVLPLQLRDCLRSISLRISYFAIAATIALVFGNRIGKLNKLGYTWMHLFSLKSVVAVGICTFMGLSPLSVYADVKSEIQADYNKMNNAICHKDLDTTVSLIYEPFVIVEKCGAEHSFSMADLRETFLEEFSTFDSIDSRTNITKIESLDAGVVATVTEVTVYKQTNPKTHAIMKLVVHETDRDYWVNVDDKWLLERSRIIQQTKRLQK